VAVERGARGRRSGAALLASPPMTPPVLGAAPETLVPPLLDETRLAFPSGASDRRPPQWKATTPIAAHSGTEGRHFMASP
jgi:hypothetical protein